MVINCWFLSTKLRSFLLNCITFNQKLLNIITSLFIGVFKYITAHFFEVENRIHVYNLSDLVFKIMNIKKLFLQDVRNGTWKGIYLIMMSLKESFKSFKSLMFFLIGSTQWEFISNAPKCCFWLHYRIICSVILMGNLTFHEFINKLRVFCTFLRTFENL